MLTEGSAFSGNTGTVCSGALPAVQNGYIGSGSNDVGADRGVFCNDGYENTYPNFIFCTSSLEWSQPGTCERKTTTSKSLKLKPLKFLKAKKK